MKHGLVFSGGGAYAAYEVGVAKALLCGRSPATGLQPLAPAVVTGTSAGAFNAAILASRPADPAAMADHLESVWLQQVAAPTDNVGNGVFRIRGDLMQYLKSPERVLRRPAAPLAEMTRDSFFFALAAFDRWREFITDPGSFERRAMELIDVSAIFSVEPLAELIEHTVDLDALRRPEIGIRIVATNWKTGEPHVFSNADITHRSVLASAAIPGIFPPVEISGGLYVDGGASMNTPLKPGIDAGAETLHVISIDPELHKTPVPRLPSTLDVVERGLAIIRVAQMRTDLRLAAAINRAVPEDPKHRKVAVHVYRPRADFGGIFGMLNFNRERLRSLIETGFREAEAHSCEASGCVL